eukprot:15274194-Ditylum_brightwellii.AAC.1
MDQNDVAYALSSIGDLQPTSNISPSNSINSGNAVAFDAGEFAHAEEDEDVSLEEFLAGKLLPCKSFTTTSTTMTQTDIAT